MPTCTPATGLPLLSVTLPDTVTDVAAPTPADHPDMTVATIATDPIRRAATARRIILVSGWKPDIFAPLAVCVLISTIRHTGTVSGDLAGRHARISGGGLPGTPLRRRSAGLVDRWRPDGKQASPLIHNRIAVSLVAAELRMASALGVAAARCWPPPGCSEVTRDLAVRAEQQTTDRSPFLEVTVGRLAAATGDTALASATDRMPFDQALLRVMAAEIIGGPSTLRWLRAALDLYEAHDGRLAIDRVRALLRDAGATTPRRRRRKAVVPAPLIPFGVTAVTAEVLAHVAEGLTNPAIAEKLFLSVRDRREPRVITALEARRVITCRVGASVARRAGGEDSDGTDDNPRLIAAAPTLGEVRARAKYPRTERPTSSMTR